MLSLVIWISTSLLMKLTVPAILGLTMSIDNINKLSHKHGYSLVRVQADPRDPYRL